MVSIAGNKKDNITIIYTPWSNLKKDGSMDVGQVSFKDQRKVSFYLLHSPSLPLDSLASVKVLFILQEATCSSD